MRIALTLFLSCFTLAGMSQNAKTQQTLNEIKGQWQLDSKGKVTYTRVVNVADLPMVEIYDRAFAYFLYNYEPGRFENFVTDSYGGKLVGRGYYNDVFTKKGKGYSMPIDTWYILRIDMEEGRAKIYLTLTYYDKEILVEGYDPKLVTTKVAEDFPIKDVGISKESMAQTFISTHKHVLETLNGIESAIHSGNVDEVD